MPALDVCFGVVDLEGDEWAALGDVVGWEEGRVFEREGRDGMEEQIAGVWQGECAWWRLA